MRDYLLLLLLCGVLFFPFLGGSVLWDFDEGYFASIAKEMYEKGEWIVPTFSERELGDKPILIFWGMILSFSLFGVNEFAVRFPTALYGTATVLLTYHLARRLFPCSSPLPLWGRVRVGAVGTRESPHPAPLPQGEGTVVPEYRLNGIGLRSAFILATMLLFGVETRGTTCDGAMICWLVAALTVYVYGCKGFRDDFIETPSELLEERIGPWFPDRWRTVVLMNACFGMAVLAKGPAMAVFGTAVIGLFLLVKAFPGRIDRHPIRWAVAFLRIYWKMRPLTAALTILAIAGPWFVVVGWKTNGEWLRMFFIEHHYQRSIEPTRSHVGFGLGPLYYPVVTLFGTFPWSIFFAPWLVDLYRRLRRGSEPKDAYHFAVCWIVLYFGFFTLVSTKLMHYVVPAYPAIAITLGVYLAHWRRDSDLAEKYWTPTVIGALVVIGVGLLATMYRVLPKYFPDEQATGIVIGLFPLLMGIAGLIAYRQGGRKALDIVYVLLALTFFPMLFQWAAGRISEHAFHDREFFHNIAADEDGGAPLVVCAGMDEPSWVFYSGQPLRQIDVETLKECRTALELRNELIERDKRRPICLSRFPLPKGRLYLIVNERDYEDSVRPCLGEKLKEIDRIRRFMRQYDQLLLAENTTNRQ